MKMTDPLSKFETWALKRIFNRIVTQGPNHADNIKLVYKMLREACVKEFTEDNSTTTYYPTMDDFLKELFESSQSRNVYAEEIELEKLYHGLCGVLYHWRASEATGEYPLVVEARKIRDEYIDRVSAFDNRRSLHG